jgi:hypothetical protein
MPSRIIKLQWKHGGMQMHCEVGLPLPRCFKTGAEPVLETIDCGDYYAIHTNSRRGTYRSAVRARKDEWSTEMTETIFSEVVFRRAVEALGSAENALSWLNIENKALGGIRPVDRSHSAAGIQLVLDLLGRIEHGISS